MAPAPGLWERPPRAACLPEASPLLPWQLAPPRRAHAGGRPRVFPQARARLGCSAGPSPAGALGTRGWPARVQRPPQPSAPQLFLGRSAALGLWHPDPEARLILGWFGLGSPAQPPGFPIPDFSSGWKGTCARVGLPGATGCRPAWPAQVPRPPRPPPSLLVLPWRSFASSLLPLLLPHHYFASLPPPPPVSPLFSLSLLLPSPRLPRFPPSG